MWLLQSFRVSSNIPITPTVLWTFSCLSALLVVIGVLILQYFEVILALNQQLQVEISARSGAIDQVSDQQAERLDASYVVIVS